MKLLIENGADVNVVDKNNYSPLVIAVQRGDRLKKAAELLIQKGADVNIVSEPDGESPITLAAHEGTE